MCSCSGSCNCNSTTIPRGPQGVPGINGAAATIAAGNTIPLPAGTAPTVTNVGNSSAAVFNFGIPVGQQGPPGPAGSITKLGPVENSFLQPAINNSVTINVENASWMALSSVIYIGLSTQALPGGYYIVSDVIDLTHVQIIRMPWVIPGFPFADTGNNVGGDNNTLVIPGGIIGPEGVIKKILDESSEDAVSTTAGAAINNHSWTILDLTNNQDTVSFDFIITSLSGNGNFSVVSVNIGATQVSRFTDSDATEAAKIKYNTDPATIPAGYISSSDPLLSEDINFIKGVVKITRRTNATIEYDITYYMYNSIVQGSYPSLSSTKMIQKMFNAIGGHSVSSIDASGLNFSFSVTPNFMSGGDTFGTDIKIYNAIKLSSIL